MNGRWAVLGLAGAAFAFAAATTGGACTNPNSHIFIARPYETARDCVDPSEGIDVVDGPEPAGGCAPVCVYDMSGAVYVSGMCPPYPQGDKLERPDTGLDPTCTLALAAYDRNDTCNPDGGSTNPPVPEGGAEGGAPDAAGEGPAGDAPSE